MAASEKTPVPTFSHHGTLPSLPLPSLEQTLTKYLDSVKPHVTAEEFEKTKRIVDGFYKGIGGTLHEELKNRAAKERNWLERLWEDNTYLKLRMPIHPYINFYGAGPMWDSLWPPKAGTQLERAAFLLWQRLGFWQKLRKQTVPVTVSGGNLWCMNQFRSWPSCCRIPGKDIDTLRRYFKTEDEGESPTHIVVFHNGHIYRMEGFHRDGMMLTVPELQQQLQWIYDDGLRKGEGLGLGSMTTADRVSWFNCREKLISLSKQNEDNLLMIQSAILGICFDKAVPVNDDEILREGMLGRVCANRWFDKSLLEVVYSNGTCLTAGDHAPFDAMIIVQVHTVLTEEARDMNGQWKGSMEIRPMPKPIKLEFAYSDEIKDAVSQAKEQYDHARTHIDTYSVTFTCFGQSSIRDLAKLDVKLHPDVFVQLSIQLAYYYMYKRVVPTYETAATRKFYHGRTETVRACTTESAEWCRAMTDPSSSIENRYVLLRKAEAKHSKLMKEAMNAEGCDRHLFGLQCLVGEKGLPMPEIYTDPSWAKSGGGGNFILSTSWIGYTPAHGGVAPMCPHGYGCFYRINDPSFTFFTLCWTRDKDTDSRKFYSHIHKAMNDQLALWKTTSPQDTSAKL